MSKKKISMILMAFMAMSFFRPSLSLAQADSSKPAFKIKTPNTKNQLSEKPVEASEDQEPKSLPADSSSPRRLHQHGFGFGLGETFLMGNYGKHGEDKITADLFYSYAASYSFDLLLNAHMSEHKDQDQAMKILGLTSSIKAKVVEYDSFSPYVLGGLGFYAPQAKRMVGNDNKWSDQKITFGMNFGGGADLRLNDHYVVGLLGQVHWPFTVKQDTGSDIKGYYFKLLITGMYLF
jgi:opacity protein-like surface antigen